jgi:hypothetical protein
MGCESENCVYQSQRPWQERRLVKVDWSRNLELGAYRFDAATAVGHPEAVNYDPLAVVAPDVALEEGYIATTVGVLVTWSAMADGTPGCAFDVPNFDPAVECAPVAVRLRYEFRRQTN